ncbi:hypothetical protein [Bradyrhizobium sp.]|uniref:hypothetical protein n=1 Tax=Bradyrhizobium sp. TaxID=376 RepID=UPI0029C08DD7|nr:hypothetical protein [Bradyrhizobium sp.]
MTALGSISADHQHSICRHSVDHFVHPCDVPPELKRHRKEAELLGGPILEDDAIVLIADGEVLAIFAPFGTASNIAIQRYMNNKRVPQLFVISGATRWG